MTANFDMIQNVYAHLKEKQDKAREVLGRPMTYAEKVLYSHLWNSPDRELERGKDYVELAPDRVAIDRKSVV